jgi:toxin ParE1/3/4
MRVRWTPAAAADLQSISDYLKDTTEAIARQPCGDCIYATIPDLKQWPGRGRPGREPGTREVFFPRTPHVAVYGVKEQTFEIVRIYHTAQDRP